ncbi:MAG: hypothetical protein P4L20_02775 [Acidimicrobiales bacterium]|nr:hypothetical protein [Acidimicrobiales bacterium]
MRTPVRCGTSRGAPHPGTTGILSWDVRADVPPPEIVALAGPSGWSRVAPPRVEVDLGAQ